MNLQEAKALSTTAKHAPDQARAIKLKRIIDLVKSANASMASTLMNVSNAQVGLCIDHTGNAINLLKEAWRADTENKYLNFLLGISYHAQNNHELAIAHLLHYSKSSQINPICMPELSLSMLDSEMLEEYIFTYSIDLAAIDPEHSQLKSFSKKLYDLGLKLHNDKHFQEAIYILQECTLLSPSNPWPYHLIGASLFKMGMAEAAIKPLETAISLNDKPTAHYFRLAEVCESLNRTQLAHSHYIKAYELSNDLKYLTLALKAQDSDRNSETSQLIPKLLKHDLSDIIDATLDYPKVTESIISHLKNCGDNYKAKAFINKLSIHEELDSTHDTLLLVFASRNEDYTNIKFQFKPQLSSYSVKKIFLRDVQDSWYSKGFPFLTDSIDATAEHLRGILSKIQYSKLICMGSSSGGYAALLFGYLLQANLVYAFSPQTLIPRPSPFPDEKLLADCDTKYFDIASLGWDSSPATCNIFFSNQYPSDSQAAQRMSNYKSFALHGFDAGHTHNIAGWLKANGKLGSIIKQMLS